MDQDTKNDLMVKFAVDMSKRRMRAANILGLEKFQPHAYIPIEINFEKIKAKFKELGIEDELPDDIPEEIKKEGMMVMTLLPLDFQSDKAASLISLGHFVSVTDTTKVIVAYTTTMKVEDKDWDVLSIVAIDMKSHDTMFLIPFHELANEDIEFMTENTFKSSDEEIRNSFTEGFLHAESLKYLEKNPTADTDAYVDGLSTLYPNVQGALNQKEC